MVALNTNPSIILLLTVFVPLPIYKPETFTDAVVAQVLINGSPKPPPIILLVMLFIFEPLQIIPPKPTVVKLPTFAVLVYKALIIFAFIVFVALPPIFIPLIPPDVLSVLLWLMFAIILRVILWLTPLEVAFIPKKILFVTKFKLLGTVKLPIILLSILTAPPVTLIPVN